MWVPGGVSVSATASVSVFRIWAKTLAWPGGGVAWLTAPPTHGNFSLTLMKLLLLLLLVPFVAFAFYRNCQIIKLICIFLAELYSICDSFSYPLSSVNYVWVGDFSFGFSFSVSLNLISGSRQLLTLAGWQAFLSISYKDACFWIWVKTVDYLLGYNISRLRF